jgi:hypothetical protein
MIARLKGYCNLDMSLINVIGWAFLFSGACDLLEAWTDGAVLWHRWRWNKLRKQFGENAVRKIFVANGLILIIAGLVLIRI